MSKVLKLLQVSLFTVLLYVTATAQNTNKSRLKLEGKISLDSLTRYVHQHTGIRFSFNSTRVKGTKEIFFAKAEYSFPRLLQHIKKNTSLYYELFKGYVIFQDNPPRVKPGAVTTVKNKKPVVPIRGKQVVIKNTGRPKQNQPKPILIIKKANIDVAGNPDSPRNKREEATTLLDSNVRFVENTKEQAGTKPGSSLLKTNVPVQVFIKDSATLIENKNEQANKNIVSTSNLKRTAARRKTIWHSQAGFYAAEVLYVNAAAEIGIKPIHVTAGVSSNFTRTVARFGLGSILKNGKKSQWQLYASIGFLKDGYDYDTASLIKSIGIKGRLYTGTLSYNKKLNTKWLLKVGPSFNLLKATYYIDGNQSEITEPINSTAGAKQKLALLNPPFILQQKYKEQNSVSIKKWIGLSIAVYYNLWGSN